MPGAVDWALAERIAVRVAGREPFAESYHYDSLTPDFVELTAVAERLVGDVTGLRSLSGEARARVTDREGWIRANVAAFQRLLRPLISRLEDKAAGPMAPVARKVAAAEVGVMFGWMSGRVLGQYDLLIVEEEAPHDQDIVYYVGPNVLAMEKRYAFPPREFRLWLALHEVTHRAQFTAIPWMREHFLSLVEQVLDNADPDPGRIAQAVTRALGALREGRNPLDDGGVAALMASPEQREVLDRVAGLMSLLEGHGDVTMDRAGAHLIPNAERFSRVMRERRRSAQGLVRLVQQLVGLEAKLAQYEQGERFIETVERRGGSELVELAWVRPENLPTLGEIRDPEGWIARVSGARVA